MNKIGLMTALLSVMAIVLAAVSIVVFFVVAKAVFDGRLLDSFLYSLLFLACTGGTVGLATVAENL